MNLILVLIISFGGAFLTYLAGKISSRIRDICAVVISSCLFLYISFQYGKELEIQFCSSFLGFPLLLRLNQFAWIFALMISLIGALVVIFSLSYIRGKEKTDYYYLMILLVNAAMLAIVLAGDLVSFFIFWEIMSWTTFLMICYKKGPALSAGMKYLIMSIFGSMAMLVGILTIYSAFDTVVISELAAKFAPASPGFTLFVIIMFFTGFGIKNAIVPFHTWLPYAHAEAPSPFSSILSGVLIKIGTYGFILFLYVLSGIYYSTQIHKWITIKYILSIIAAITIVIPTLIAILQDDAKRLLAWSTIGQAGYIFLGISFGTSLSLAGGMLHFINHALFKALLFLVVGAVEFRTNGIRDLNSLGGLIKRMPFTFLAALIGVSGLIGIPLTNGFVSKWMIYKTLIIEHSPFLAFAALFGTWGTILYCYKFLHSIFLGQIPENLKSIKKSPCNMWIPFFILSASIIILGILPGIPLKVINRIIVSMGLESLNVSWWGLTSDTGILNTINISIALVVTGIITGLIFKIARRSRRIEQDDNYAAGAAVPKDRYIFSVDFYAPFYRMVEGFLKDYLDIFYGKIARITEALCDNIRKFYNGYVGNYIMYIILFLGFLIFVQLKWSIF